jgi:hypothetical protein
LTWSFITVSSCVSCFTGCCSALVSAYKCILALASVGMTAATTTFHISDSKSAVNFLHSVTITATTFAIDKAISTDVCVFPVAVKHTAAVAYRDGEDGRDGIGGRENGQKG